MVASARTALGAYSLRPLNGARPVAVQATPDGQPTAMRRLEGGSWRTVLEVQDRWRIDDEWWRERAIARVYYRLLLADGSQVSLFRDEVDGVWFEQRAAQAKPGEARLVQVRRRSWQVKDP